MKLYLLLFSLIVFCPLTAPAQIPAERIPPVYQPQQGEDWKIFEPADEEFALIAPADFSPGFINYGPERKVPNRSYRLVLNGNYYFIFSDALKNPYQNNMVFDFAGKTADRNSQNVLFKFQDGWGFYHRVLSVKTADRIYTFQTVSLTEKSPTLDRFFAGIKIGNTPAITKEIVSDTVQTAPGAVKNESSGTGSGSGIGTGAGASKDQTSPLKLLSKPRPSYNDYARAYQIVGVIKLRVTFSADGTISRIEALNKLPFGLTEAAITAARKIQFAPQMKDGKPQAVVKMIEYSFSIY